MIDEMGAISRSIEKKHSRPYLHRTWGVRVSAITSISTPTTQWGVIKAIPFFWILAYRIALQYWPNRGGGPVAFALTGAAFLVRIDCYSMGWRKGRRGN